MYEKTDRFTIWNSTCPKWRNALRGVPICSEPRSPHRVIAVRRMAAAVVVSFDEYKELTGRKESLLDFFQNSALRDVELDIKRDRDMGRDLDL